MKKRILIIDDEQPQAEGLQKGLGKVMPNYHFDCAFTEDSILQSVEDNYYTLAIVDLRMDNFDIDGIDVVNKVFESNPFAKVIIVSAFKSEYLEELNKLISTGRVLGVLEKDEIDAFIFKLKEIVEDYHTKFEDNLDEVNKALFAFYSESVSETDTYVKGKNFEHLMALLFECLGFKSIQKRFKDLSLNEVDLIVRNEIDDDFLNKFGKYILIECKNHPEQNIGKNDLILFQSKLQNTSGLSDLGVFATTGSFARTTYTEVVRNSRGKEKILLLTNKEILRLIMSENKIEDFKKLIDEQVKDN